MALFVRKFAFATRFCYALIVYFRLFLNSKPFFPCFAALCVHFQTLLFLPLAIPALHPLFCSTIRNKKQRRRFFRTHLCCPSVQFNTLTLCSG